MIEKIVCFLIGHSPIGVAHHCGEFSMGLDAAHEICIRCKRCGEKMNTILSYAKYIALYLQTLYQHRELWYDCNKMEKNTD